MAIELSTERWVEVHKTNPRGSHYWRFRAVGNTTGNRKWKALDWTMETDGPFPKARERALEGARKAFGVTADVTVALIP